MTGERPATWDGPPGQPCECPDLAGDCDGTHLPPEAITAANNAAELWAQRTLMSPDELGYRHAMVNAALTAAAEHIRAAKRAASVRKRGES